MSVITEKEALKRFINAFGKKTPALDTDEYWEKFANGMNWLKSKFPDGEYKDYAERYFQAYMLIACIEYDIERSEDNEDS